MSGYLARVAARALGVAPVLRPRGTARFEASPLDGVSTPRSLRARPAPSPLPVSHAPAPRIVGETLPAVRSDNGGDDAPERPSPEAGAPGERRAPSFRPRRARVVAAEGEEVEAAARHDDLRDREPEPDAVAPAPRHDYRVSEADDLPLRDSSIERRAGERRAFDARIEPATAESPVEPADAAHGHAGDAQGHEPVSSTARQTRAPVERLTPAARVEGRAAELAPDDSHSPVPDEGGDAATVAVVAGDPRPVAGDPRPVAGDPPDTPRARPVRTVVEIPSKPAEPRPRAEPAPAPDVRVTIGRIEVTAAAPPVRPAPVREPAPSPRPPRLSLDEYLDRRNGSKT